MTFAIWFNKASDGDAPWRVRNLETGETKNVAQVELRNVTLLTGYNAHGFTQYEDAPRGVIFVEQHG